MSHVIKRDIFWKHGEGERLRWKEGRNNENDEEEQKGPRERLDFYLSYRPEHLHSADGAASWPMKEDKKDKVKYYHRVSRS